MFNSREMASLSHSSGTTRPVSILAICDSEHPTRRARSNGVQPMRVHAPRITFALFVCVLIVFLSFLLVQGAQKDAQPWSTQRHPVKSAGATPASHGETPSPYKDRGIGRKGHKTEERRTDKRLCIKGLQRFSGIAGIIA